MKGNRKRLAVFVILAVFAPFTVAVMALAHPPDHQAIHGQYAFTGSAQCLIAPTGFNASLQPTNGLWLLDTSSWEGVYTFNKDGTGEVTAIYRYNDLPCPAIPIPPSAGSATVSWKFTYTMTDEDIITITLAPGTYLGTYDSGPRAGQSWSIDRVPQDGVISVNGKNINVTCGAPTLINILTSPGGPPSGSQLNCNVSHVLIRIEPED